METVQLWVGFLVANTIIVTGRRFALLDVLLAVLALVARVTAALVVRLEIQAGTVVQAGVLLALVDVLATIGTCAQQINKNQPKSVVQHFACFIMRMHASASFRSAEECVERTKQVAKRQKNTDSRASI